MQPASSPQDDGLPPEERASDGSAVSSERVGEHSLPPEPEGELIGQVIGGRYRVTGVIGQGGMGVVYGAKHLELDQPVAIKVLPAIYARDPETLKRFEQEAKTASRVKHANVVQVFDLGRLPTGQPYLAMELLDGRDLESMLEAGRVLSHAEILDVLGPMAAALDALHRENVVHRDVKPSNVFFARNSSGGETVKLVDFGLATLTAAGEGAERLTRVGHVVGTAVYMPPESARGALCEPAGDIYSLAVMAFELLTGAAPFDGPPMAVLMDKVSQCAPTLSQVARRPFGREIEALFSSALDREPSGRPRTATDFVQRLRACLSSAADSPDDAAPAVRSSDADRARPTADLVRAAPAEPERRRRAGALAVAGTILTLSLGIAGYAFMARAPEPTPPTAPAPAPVAPHEPVLEMEAPQPEPVAAAEVVVAAEPAAPTEPTRPRARATPRTTPAAHEEPAPVVTPPTPSSDATPDSTDRSGTLVRDASRAMLHGEIPRARDLYREATLAAPRNAGAWRGLGLASERLHLLPEARTAYQRYLDLAPGAADAATVRERLSHL
jgi:hypothetical protein